MLAIIGGSGFYSLPKFKSSKQFDLSTCYGKPSSDIAHAATKSGKEICFLARHGFKHKIPPHKINYRANIQVLVESGVDKIIAVNAVGSCNPNMVVGDFVLPDQIIDYSYNREHSFFDELDGVESYVDFTEPFCAQLKEKIASAFNAKGTKVHQQATYACTQGPRFETAAEIRRIRADGCDLVGMTMMPEASLARERGLHYAAICVVVNMAAGMTSEPIELETINAVLTEAIEQISTVVFELG